MLQNTRVTDFTVFQLLRENQRGRVKSPRPTQTKVKNYILLFIDLRGRKTIKKKKNTKTLKEELLNSLRKSYTLEESDFNIQNITDQLEAL